MVMSIDDLVQRFVDTDDDPEFLHLCVEAGDSLEYQLYHQLYCALEDGTLQDFRPGVFTSEEISYLLDVLYSRQNPS